ncbi:hypothetical protein [Clostridium sp.]|uniref:hypothetical protein n=1 Tax=Clostridium sp. TaxID=1506 RepID=UPI003217E5D6
MVKIKKNWLEDINTFIIVFIGVEVIIGVMSLLFINIKPRTKEAFQSIEAVYNQIFTMSLIALSMYPLFAFKAICPQIGKEKLYLSTSNLPLNKKQLFWKGIKVWLMIFPTYLLVGVLVYLLFSFKTEISGLIYLDSLLQPIAIIILGFVLQMQIISGIILAKSKNIKLYKIVIGAILGNVLLVGGCLLAIEVFNIDTLTNGNWMFGILGIFIVVSLALVLTLWKDVENMHR